MVEHDRRKEDLTEPQTIDEIVRATYRDVKDIKSVVFGDRGLCNRTTILETIVKVMAWVVGIGFSAIGAISGWMLLFKKGT